MTSTSSRLAAYVAEHSYGEEDGKTTIMMYCNAGYVGYTRNCLVSLGKCGIPMSCVSIFATDDAAYGALTAAGYDVYRFSEWKTPNFLVTSQFLRWTNAGGGDWSRVMAAKMEIVYALLQLGYNVLYTDSDIVWQKDARTLLREILKHGTACIAIMDDTTWNGQCNNLCMGFFFARSNDDTKRLFNPLRIEWKSFRNDQHYVNSVMRREGWLRSGKTVALDKNVYPNGNVWQKYAENAVWVDKVAVVHYNYLVGNTKCSTMKRYGMWYV